MRNCSVSQVLFLVFENQKLLRNFQAWRAVGSNDLFDAAWLLDADVGFLHLATMTLAEQILAVGVLIVDNGVPRINSNITSLIFGDERNKGSLCHAPSIIRCLLLRKPFRTSSALLTGVRPSNVPLINKTGMFDLTGARKLLPRSGLPHESQTSGNTMSAAFSKSVSLNSHWILLRRSTDAPDEQSVINAIGEPILDLDKFSHCGAISEKSPFDAAR